MASSSSNLALSKNLNMLQICIHDCYNSKMRIKQYPWTQETKQELSRQHELRTKYEADFTQLKKTHGWQIGSQKIAGYYFTYSNEDLTYPTRRKLKQIWNEHVDRDFFEQDFLVIHWLGWLNRNKPDDDLAVFLTKNPIDQIHHDELSAHAYLHNEGKKATYSWQDNGVKGNSSRGDIGIVIDKRRITYANNDDACSEELSQAIGKKKYFNNEMEVPMKV